MIDESNRMRLIGVAIIWGAIAIIGTKAAEALTEQALLMVVALAILGCMAVMGTAIVFEPWRQDRFKESSAEKAKRRSRIDKLIDNLDDDELEQLRAQLGADGEFITLEELASAKRR